MSDLKRPNAIVRVFRRLDALANTAVYETRDTLKRAWAAYGCWLERFRIWGVKRLVIDLADDAATFGLVIALGLLVLALPPFVGTGDVWNQGRQHAITFTDSAGEVIGRRGVRQDDAVPLNEIPRHVIEAVLATEDARFYDHFGIDIQGTARAAALNAQAEGVVQGGSSITQQLAKNLFLSPERSLRRKIEEAFLALWIEANLSKDEILKLYLDRSYFGGGNYGIEAAAQFYFGKSVRDVTLAEAAILAGLPKAPSTFAPHVNAEAARARANVVLNRMLDVGYITSGELFEARREPAEVVSQSEHQRTDYLLDWAYRETLQLLEEYGLEGEYVLEVKTTIDADVHDAAVRIVNEVLEEEGPDADAHQAALVAMEPDGALKAVIGGRDYEASQFNRATEARRQPGSAFKPFVYIAALLNGYRPDSEVIDQPVSIGGWSPQNHTERYVGRTTLTTALARSINTIPVHLMNEIGRQPIIEAAHQVGLTSDISPVPSLPLGTNELTLMELTRGYATVANGGQLATPYSVLEIRRPNGEIIYARERNAPKPSQAVPEAVVADLNEMLHEVVANGTGRRADLEFTPQAGKTGTTQDYRDAWFIGYTAHLVAGVWFGNDDFSAMRRVTGGTLPAETWRRFMAEALEGREPAPLPGLPLDDGDSMMLTQGGETLEHPSQVSGDENAPAPFAETEQGSRPGSIVTAFAAPEREAPRSPISNDVVRSLRSLMEGR